MLKEVEQNQARILRLLADLVPADPFFLPLFVLLVDFWALFFHISPKGRKERSLDAAGCV